MAAPSGSKIMSHIVADPNSLRQLDDISLLDRGTGWER